MKFAKTLFLAALIAVSAVHAQDNESSAPPAEDTTTPSVIPSNSPSVTPEPVVSSAGSGNADGSDATSAPSTEKPMDESSSEDFDIETHAPRVTTTAPSIAPETEEPVDETVDEETSAPETTSPPPSSASMLSTSAVLLIAAGVHAVW